MDGAEEWHRNRVALLFDADNIPAWHAPRAVSIADREGELAVFRAYGREEVLGSSAWDSNVRELGAQLVYCPDGCYGKNAADILIAVDAMDMLAAHSCDVFAIASGDSDFLPLVRRLRAAGKRVVGICARGRAAGYRDEFDAFYVLAGPDSCSDTICAEDEEREALVGFFSQCIREVSEGGSCCSLSGFSNRVSKLRPALDPHRYGCRTLKKLVLATGAFDIRQAKGGDFVIRAV